MQKFERHDKCKLLVIICFMGRLKCTLHSRGLCQQMHFVGGPQGFRLISIWGLRMCGGKRKRCVGKTVMVTAVQVKRKK